VTFCVADRQAVFRDPTFASIATAQLRYFRDAGFYNLYGYAVMPDHVHAIMRSRKSGIHLSKVVGTLRASISLRIRQLMGHFAWQRGYHEQIINSERECLATVDYVLANPARAGLVPPGEQYPHSGVLDRWR